MWFRSAIRQNCGLEVNNVSCEFYQGSLFPPCLRREPRTEATSKPGTEATSPPTATSSHLRRCRVHLHTDGWSVLPLQTEILKSCVQHLKNNKNIPPTCNKEIWEVRPGLFGYTHTYLSHTVTQQSKPTWLRTHYNWTISQLC